MEEEHFPAFPSSAHNIFLALSHPHILQFYQSEKKRLSRLTSSQAHPATYLNPYEHSLVSDYTPLLQVQVNCRSPTTLLHTHFGWWLIIRRGSSSCSDRTQRRRCRKLWEQPFEGEGAGLEGGFEGGRRGNQSSRLDLNATQWLGTGIEWPPKLTAVFSTFTARAVPFAGGSGRRESRWRLRFPLHCPSFSWLDVFRRSIFLPKSFMYSPFFLFLESHNDSWTRFRLSIHVVMTLFYPTRMSRRELKLFQILWLNINTAAALLLLCATWLPS